MCPPRVFSYSFILQKTQCCRVGESIRASGGWFQEKGALWLEMTTWLASQKRKQSDPQSRLSCTRLEKRDLFGTSGSNNKGETMEICHRLAYFVLTLALKVKDSSFTHMSDRKGHVGKVRWVSGEDSSLLSGLSSVSQMCLGGV